MKLLKNNEKKLNIILSFILLFIIFYILREKSYGIDSLIAIFLSLGTLAVAFKVNKHKWYFIILALLLLTFGLKIIDFNLFPQVKVLIKTNPLELIKVGHPHGYRYLAVYISVYIAKTFGLSLDLTYTIYCLVLMTFMICMMVSIIKSCINKKNELKNQDLFIYFLVAAMVIGIGHFMNGRLIPAYFGLTCIIYIYVKVIFKEESWLKIYYIYLPIAVLMTTVSSGTMMVALLSLMICTIIYICTKKKYYETIIILLATLPITIKFGQYVIQMINKNLDFFGGGVEGLINMTKHGIGRINSKIIIVLIFALVLSLAYLKFCFKAYKSNKAETLLFIVAPTALGCGIFGISTATMVIPPAIMLFTLYSFKFLFVREENV